MRRFNPCAILPALILALFLAAPFIYAPGLNNQSAPQLLAGTHITQIVTRTIDTPIDDFYTWFSNASLEDILPGSPMVPRVTGTELIAGTWGEVGAKRKVLLADGSTALEQIIANDPPKYFSYKVWSTGGLGQRLIRYIRGEFFLKPTSDGKTHIEWRYSFKPRSPLAYPHLTLFANLGFQPFLVSGIEAIKSGGEAAVSKTKP